MDKRIFTIQFSFHKHYIVLADSPLEALTKYINFQHTFGRCLDICLDYSDISAMSMECWKYTLKTGEVFFIHENELIK